MSQLQRKLEQLYPLINQCQKKTRCYPHSKNTVPGIHIEGKDKPVLLLAEAPGKNEDEEGVPLVGKAGEVLQKLLINIEWTSGFFITNIMKCRPPDNRDPLEGEQELCGRWLLKQIEIVQPRGVLCLGKTSSQFVLRLAGHDPERWQRGLQFMYNSMPVLCTWHPAACLYAGGGHRKEQLKEDLILAKFILSKEYPFL